MKLTFRAYVWTSLVGVAALLLFAMNAHEGLYSTLLFLSNARICLAIITNFLLMVGVWFMRLTIWLFLGRLRALETEQIMDAGGGFLMDTIMFLLLSSPTINGTLASVLTLFQHVCFIIVVKGFHLICQIRVVRVFESGLATSALLGLFYLMVLLLIGDVVLVRYFYSLVENGSSLYLWLLFEFMGMTIAAVSFIGKFLLNYIDLRMENGWTGKSAAIFILDVTSDVMSLLTVLSFMCIYIVNYPSQLPIHMTANIFQVLRTLTSKLRSFRRCRILINEMSKRFPEATFEELEEADQCIICRDMLYEGARKLPCNHIFHIECLKAWFIQQQICPTCRADVLINTNTISGTATRVTTTEPEEEIGQDDAQRRRGAAGDPGPQAATHRPTEPAVGLRGIKRMLHYVAPTLLAKDSAVEDMRWGGETKNPLSQRQKDKSSRSSRSPRFLGLFPVEWGGMHEPRHSRQQRRAERFDRRPSKESRSRRRTKSVGVENDDFVATQETLMREIDIAKEMSEFYKQQALFWWAYVTSSVSVNKVEEQTASTSNDPSSSFSSSSSASSSNIPLAAVDQSECMSSLHV